jgi:hypothetical protein
MKETLRAIAAESAPRQKARLEDFATIEISKKSSFCLILIGESCCLVPPPDM